MISLVAAFGRLADGRTSYERYQRVNAESAFVRGAFLLDLCSRRGESPPRSSDRPSRFGFGAVARHDHRVKFVATERRVQNAAQRFGVSRDRARKPSEQKRRRLRARRGRRVCFFFFVFVFVCHFVVCVFMNVHLITAVASCTSLPSVPLDGVARDLHRARRDE